MDAPQRRRRSALHVLTALAMLLAGCSSHTSSAVPTSAASSASKATTARESAGPVTVSRTPSASSSTSTALTGAPCAAAATRAVAAAIASLPDGTSRKPTHLTTCTADRTLHVEFPATTRLTWTVTVEVSPGTAGDCQLGAADAGAACSAVVGHAGFIGAEAVCSAISCDQAWVFGHGQLAIVGGSVPGSQPGISQPAIPDFNGLGTIIGASVLEALTT